MKTILIKTISLVLAVLFMFSFSACSSTNNDGNDSDTTEGGLLGSAPEVIEKEEDIISEDEKQLSINEGMLGAEGGTSTTYDGFLGYGYDMIYGAYYNHKDIRSAHPVVDMDKLAGDNKVYIDSKYVRYAEPKIIISSSTKEFASHMATQAGVKGSFPLAGSFKVNFEMETDYQMKSNQRLVTLQANLETRRDYILYNNAALLAEYATTDFYTNVENLSAEELVNKYGTHVLTNITMGGRFDLNYLYTMKQTVDNERIRVAAKASYKYVSGSTDTSITREKDELVSSSNLRIKTYGGSVTVDPTSLDTAIGSYKEWSQKVQDGDITFIDASEVIPIWDVIAAMKIDSASQKSEAVKTYCINEAQKVSSNFKNIVDIAPTYISEIFIGEGTTPADAKNQLRGEGVLEGNIIPIDLNKSAGGRWIYLGYKTSTNKADAITNIVADYYSSSKSKDITYNGSTMKILDTDLNKGINAKYIYMYYTRDTKAGKPITELKFQEDEAFQYGNADGYQAVKCTTTNRPMDFNMDTKGVQIFFWFKRAE